MTNNEKLVSASILAVIVITGFLALNPPSITDAQMVLDISEYVSTYSQGNENDDQQDKSRSADNDGPKYICPKKNK
jgi:hypothetical protein